MCVCGGLGEDQYATDAILCVMHLDSLCYFLLRLHVSDLFGIYMYIFSSLCLYLCVCLFVGV